MNKRTLLITAVVGLLILGGGVAVVYKMKMDEPAFRGRAIPVRGIDEELVDKWQTAFETVLKNEEVLQSIVDESDYSSRLGVPAEKAVPHLKEAVRVRYRNRNDTIEVGFVGKRRDDAQLSEIAKVLSEITEKEVLEIAPSFGDYLEALARAREKAASE